MNVPVDWTGVREVHERQSNAQRQAAYRQRRDERLARYEAALQAIKRAQGAEAWYLRSLAKGVLDA